MTKTHRPLAVLEVFLSGFLLHHWGLPEALKRAQNKNSYRLETKGADYEAGMQLGSQVEVAHEEMSLGDLGDELHERRHVINH